MKTEQQLREIHRRMKLLVEDATVYIGEPAPKEAEWLRDMLGWVLNDGTETTRAGNRAVSGMLALQMRIEAIKRAKRG